MLKTTITHWLPIVTFCPVNKLPDLIFVEVTFYNDFHELYNVRKKLRNLISGKTIFMEDIPALVLQEYPDAKIVKVRLAFNKHVVTKEL